MIEGIGADLEVALALLAAAVGTGLVAGVLAGLLGVGGGIVIVPMLYWLLPLAGVDESVRMHLAVGTSLATIVPTSIVSALAHRRRGAVDAGLLRTYAPGIVAGVLIGAAFGVRAGGPVLTLIFASVALVVAADMALRRREVQLAERPVRGPAAQAIGAFIGAVSAVMGIGGGTLSVPAFTLMGVPVHRAVGTAAAIGLIISVPGALGFMLGGLDDPRLPPGSVGYVNLLAFLAIVPATMLAAPHGVRLAHAISPRALRLAFAFFLLATAVRMFHNTLAGGG
ncbi:MAG: sulfite exporter TauE/SafE family protein [Rhodospirillales bacterium]|nr:MAG: sulfite exporter TauE/SafE family protein [Rhodospirillales bacterium]